jgi:glycosyltransferase involved in cell wall biosynthesis
MVDTITNSLKRRGVDVVTMSRNSNDLNPGLSGKFHAFFSGIYSISEKCNMTNQLLEQKPDLVHVHNVYPLFSPSILVACNQLNVPVVMTCHGYHLTCPSYNHLKSGTICEKCSKGREYWCVIRNCRENIEESIAYAIRSAVARKFQLFRRNATLIIALTNFAKNKIVAAGFPSERVVVLPNMVFLPDEATDNAKGDYVAYAGRISPEKGIETLLSAASLTSLPVRLAGDCSSMPRLVEGAPPNAKFIGCMSRNQMAEFYRQARFLVVPSLCYEICPVVILEAMSHGLPVIASNVGGLAEIVEDGVTGLLVEPGNSQELSTRIKFLWENPALCREMGHAGYEKAVREYSEDVYLGRLMSIYKQAISVKK